MIFNRLDGHEIVLSLQQIVEFEEKIMSAFAYFPETSSAYRTAKRKSRQVSEVEMHTHCNCATRCSTKSSAVCAIDRLTTVYYTQNGCMHKNGCTVLPGKDYAGKSG